MSYKLKHLAKYCCKPVTEAEFEFVKREAELGGVGFCSFWGNSKRWEHLYFDGHVICLCHKQSETEIPVLDFCNKLRMTEEEARELEDDRVYIVPNTSLKHVINPDNVLKIVANKGHYFKTNEDRTEATLHKKKK